MSGRACTCHQIPTGQARSPTNITRRACTSTHRSGTYFTAPRDIAYQQVMEHGIRHRAWLVADDPVVAGELSDDWRRVLADYVPEPFRALG